MFKAPFSFDGRIRRIEYFLSGIIGGIVFGVAYSLGLATLFLGAAAGSAGGSLFGIVFGVAYSLGLATLFLGAAAGSAGGSLFGILIGIVAGIASIWFSLAQGVKRLHDLNKSGWLILICCVPIIGWVFSLYMLFADGTVGPNQYGEDPKNRMPYQPQPTSVNVTVNVSRETPAEASAEEEKTEKAE